MANREEGGEGIENGVLCLCVEKERALPTE